MTFDPTPYLLSAEQYRRAAIVLEGDPANPMADTHLLIPNMALNSFATELYMKFVFGLEKGKQSDPVHDIQKLYNKLSKAAQDGIRDRWENTNAANLMKRISVGQENDTFDATLKSFANAFVLWRYHFQFERSTLPVGDGLQIGECVRSYIFEAYPEKFEHVRLPLPNGWLPTKFHNNTYQVIPDYEIGKASTTQP